MMGSLLAACRSHGREIGASLRGIARLTFGEAEGIRAFENDRGMARRSFLAALLAFPVFLAFHYLDLLSGAAPPEDAHAFILDLLTFPISWAGFALLALPILRWLGLEGLWPRYIAAWNWSNLAQYLLLILTSLPLALHLPQILGQTAALVGYGWALWLEWYVTRLALGTSGLNAAMIVAADVGFGAIVALLPLVQLPVLHV